MDMVQFVCENDFIQRLGHFVLAWKNTKKRVVP